MNQHDQMLRDALQALLDVQNGPPLHKTKDEWESAMKAGYEALSHVNETPKNEHDSDDVLKRAPLVRLTDREIFACFDKQNTGDDAKRNVLYFAHAIMNAMIAKNGGGK